MTEGPQLSCDDSHFFLWRKWFWSLCAALSPPFTLLWTVCLRHDQKESNRRRKKPFSASRRCVNLPVVSLLFVSAPMLCACACECVLGGIMTDQTWLCGRCKFNHFFFYLAQGVFLNHIQPEFWGQPDGHIFKEMFSTCKAEYLHVQCQLTCLSSFIDLHIWDKQHAKWAFIINAFPCEKCGWKVKLMVGFNGSLSLWVGQLIMKWCHCLLTWWKMCKWMRPDHREISLSTHTLFPLLTYIQVHLFNNKVFVTQILTRCCYLKWRCYTIPHPPLFLLFQMCQQKKLVG